MASQHKQLWFAVGPDTTVAALEAATYRAFDCVWLSLSDRALLERAPLPRGMGVAVQVETAEELPVALEQLPWSSQVKVLVAGTPELLEPVRSAAADRGLGVGLLHAVVDQATLHRSLALAAEVDHLILTFRDPTNIPLELVLATTQGMDCAVVKRVETATDGISSAMTMECGADAVALLSNDVREIEALEKEFTASRTSDLALVPARVTGLRQAGMGDRVCIDCTSELFSDEGMLIGSTSTGGLMLCSETHYLPYMELRPFRVNAGALHHYVWGPDNRTWYLSELRAGMEVLAVSAGGRARTVTVGRLKIERRPLLMIEAEAEGESLNCFIQDDWHVRLMGVGGAICPSREIALGDELLAYRDRPGRHVGIAIDETIREV